MNPLDRFLTWLIDPVCDILKIEPITEKIDDFDEEEFGSTILQPIQNKPSTTFRPKTLNEYIGQRRVKIILANYIQAIKTRELQFPHTLIHGSAGMGKTTLAYIMANLLKLKLIETIAAEIEEVEQFIQKVVESQNGIVFLDEIHALKRSTAEKLYSIMEDFKLNGQPIPSFTLIGATTELGEILKDRRPLYDRFKLILELEEYLREDLIRIGRQYKRKIFPNEKVSRNVYEVVADNCRNTPRTVIRLVEATIYFRNVKKVLVAFRIIKDGYTHKDLEVLKYLHKNEKGVGLQGLASFLNTSSENYIYEIEPFLLRKGLLVRTARGRKITEEGVEKITELEKRMIENEEFLKQSGIK